MIRIGSSFHVPGIRFQSDPSGTVFAADLRRGTEWSARTAGRSLPADAPREDGSAARIQWAAAEKRRAFPAKLFISTSVGIAGFGPLSDQTALALEDAASGALGVEKENLIAAAAGPVLEHYPVGSMMEALQAARAQPFLDEPRGRGAEALGLPFRIAEGALEMGAAVFHAERTGGEVWIAATSAGIRREVLEGVRDRFWLAGPAAWRASSGIHPGDVLILLATGASPIAEVTSEEDPRTESVIAGLSTALSQLVRKRALAAGGRIPFGLFGAETPLEAEVAAGVLARFIPEILRRLSAVQGETRSGEALLDGIRCALLSAPLPGLERALVRVTIGELMLSPGLRAAAPLPGSLIQSWREGSAELRIDLGRGACGAVFWA